MNNLSLQNKALISLILLTLLYIVAIPPLLFITGLLLMSIAIHDIPLVYLSIALYFLTFIIAIPKAVYHYWQAKYALAIKTALLPLLAAFFFAGTFYFIALNFRG